MSLVKVATIDLALEKCLWSARMISHCLIPFHVVEGKRAEGRIFFISSVKTNVIKGTNFTILPTSLTSVPVLQGFVSASRRLKEDRFNWIPQKWCISRLCVVSPLQGRPGRWAGARSPGCPRCQSEAGSPPACSCSSAARQRCSPGVTYLAAGTRVGLCYTSFHWPEKEKFWIRYSYFWTFMIKQY